MEVIPKYFKYFKERMSQNKREFILRGGRRSGKTMAIAQLLTILCYNDHRIVNVASMTREQGRLGAYTDFQSIILHDPSFKPFFTFGKSPMQIVCKHNESLIVFNSYANSETAKGVACDYLFMNEANNFSKQHQIDLAANVRRAIFYDFNPNVLFWINDMFDEEDICDSTWQDNPYLSDLQKEYFHKLKERGTAPNASPIDVRNYLVYYLGIHSEFQGEVFNTGNIQVIDYADVPLQSISRYIISIDPSSLRGSDYFAMCLLGRYDDKFYVMDTYSINMGTREEIIQKILDWQSTYDVTHTYVETNGIIGTTFFEYLGLKGIDADYWYSNINKYDRIVANYETITDKVLFVDSEQTKKYLEQIYLFKKGCDFDDNIDALNNGILMMRNLE